MLDSPLYRALAVLVLLAVASLVWWVVSRRRGTFRPAGRLRVSDDGGSGHLEAVAGAVGPSFIPGERLTLVQFSSEFCSPCRRSSQTWRRLVEEDDGVTFVELDVADHLDLTRRFQVLTTPSTILLDATGARVGRVSGAPTPRRAAEAAGALEPIGLTA